MRKLALSITLTPVFLLALFTVTNAQTSSTLQAELNALLAQLAALQAQLQTTTGSTNAAPPAQGSAYGSCPNIVRTLKTGMSGSDVTALQAFLAADSRIYPEGTISGYFGTLTQYAVQRFQSRHGLVTSGTPDTTGYGLVGPGTRNLIANVCRGGTNPVPSSPSGPAGNCVAGDILINNGSTANFYSVPYVPQGSSCESYRQTRQCLNGTLSGSASYAYTTCGVGASSVPGSCTYNGAVMANGETRTFYRKESPVFGDQCQSAARTCTNGIVSGSNDYAYPSCSAATSPVSCTLNGVTLAHGQSRTYYKREDVLFGQSCSAFAGTRSCDNGTLSGDNDYRYANCSAAGAKSCTVVTTVGTTTSTTTVAHGTSRNFWSDDSVPYTTTCDAYLLARTCNDGVLSGATSYKYPKCTVVAEKSCEIDGIEVAGGATRTFYTARVNANCASIDQSRKCTNGTLSGTASYQYAYCAPSGQRYCVLDGAYVKHGESKSFYTTENPAFGSSCSQFDQVRKCTDGTLDGSAAYSNATCTEPTGRSCTLDGKTVSHNQKHTFYSRSSSSNCAQYGQERTCIDGTLSGSGDFSRSSCTTASIEGTSQVAAALAAMEQLLKDALAKLGSWF
jgi:peptidoglycan hydrolase-like protein with peptidoglycan-binding domain